MHSNHRKPVLITVPSMVKCGAHVLQLHLHTLVHVARARHRGVDTLQLCTALIRFCAQHACSQLPSARALLTPVHAATIASRMRLLPPRSKTRAMISSSADVCSGLASVCTHYTQLTVRAGHRGKGEIKGAVRIRRDSLNGKKLRGYAGAPPALPCAAYGMVPWQGQRGGGGGAVGPSEERARAAQRAAHALATKG